MPHQRPAPYSPEQAAAMREVFKHLKDQGRSSAWIANKVKTTAHTIDNFITPVAPQKAGEPARYRDPEYKIWRRYYNYAYTRLNQEDNPEMLVLLKGATGQYGNTALLSLAQLVPDTEKGSTDSIAANYSGSYLAYNITYLSDYEHVNAAWVKIYYDTRFRAVRFEHRYRTRRGVVRNAAGYVVPSDRTFTLLGSIDKTSNMAMAIIRRPAEPESHFEHLHGILLSVTRHTHPFACKILMKPLPKEAETRDYDNKITMTCVSELRLKDESDQDFENRQSFIATEIGSEVLRFIKKRKLGCRDNTAARILLLTHGV